MFEFAISLNQKRRPTKRIMASWTVSCLAHFLGVLLLIRYPQLLQGGMYLRYHPIRLVASVLSSKPNAADQEWRTVAIVRRSTAMAAPSPATLRKYLYDWSNKGPGSAIPPVIVRWGDEKQAAPEESAKSTSRARQETQEPKPVPPAPEVVASATTQSDQFTMAQSAPEPLRSGSSVEVVQNSSPAAKKADLYLPAPEQATRQAAKKGVETASDAASAPLPNMTRPTSGQRTPSTPEAPAKVSEKEQKAIRSEGSGLFDTRGFPLGEYANLIIGRIKGNWFIPSNLRDSQGHTTVVFYIGKDGQYTNAHIIMSSGSSSLDLAALNAVIESNPFPPLPQGFPGDHIGAKFVFSYNEHP